MSTLTTANAQRDFRAALRRRGGVSGDLIFRLLAGAAVVVAVGTIGLMIVDSLVAAAPVFRAFGIWGFVTGLRWAPSFAIYGALPFIYGTFVTSVIALLVAVPVAVGIAILVTEVLPPHAARPVAIAVDLLAAVPSVVWGLWGLLVLVPFIRPIEQAVAGSLGQVVPFVGPPTPGPSYFAAGLVVAFMIIPIVAAVTREVFATTPRLQREAVLALGGTRWDVVRQVVIPLGRTGLLAAVILGLGRAIGETIAVTLVIGNATRIGGSIFAPGFTLASVIANEFNEATEELHPEALIALGIVLLAIAVLINGVGVAIRRRFERGLARAR
ncbi:MAG TPA: phosphate ABC transporter permease subunit PstC [Candidatus Limnocylindrales bacterium]|nr:phosphate ABC transporter permease subunit PstC [Candidatus Limnocylindrales bacterium]